MEAAAVARDLVTQHYPVAAAHRVRAMTGQAAAAVAEWAAIIMEAAVAVQVRRVALITRLAAVATEHQTQLQAPRSLMLVVAVAGRIPMHLQWPVATAVEVLEVLVALVQRRVRLTQVVAAVVQEGFMGLTVVCVPLAAQASLSSGTSTRINRR